MLRLYGKSGEGALQACKIGHLERTSKQYHAEKAVFGVLFFSQAWWDPIFFLQKSDEVDIMRTPNSYF